LLDSLPRADYERLNPLLEGHALRMREMLQAAGDPIEYVYFPTSGIVSLLTVLENGMMIEFATVGREGTTGVPLFLDMQHGTMALVSQLDGDSLRMRAADFTKEVAATPPFAAIVARYAGVLLALAAQSAACNRAHDVSAPCARWLLMTHDQARRDEFPITQEFLAQMLGVGRSSVSEVAGSLQNDGIVKYHRGRVTILDRERLEAASCECYAVISQHLKSLPGPSEAVA
jgi:CRP-like cAMP-binding protein